MCLCVAKLLMLEVVDGVGGSRPGTPYSVGDRSMVQTNSPEILVSVLTLFLDRPYPKVA